jgi:hypothetical protein
VQVELFYQVRNILRQRLDLKTAAIGARFAVSPQVHADQAKVRGERPLPAEEAAMRHHSVQKHNRAACAFLAERDARPVTGGEMVQIGPLRRRPVLRIGGSSNDLLQ